MKALKITLILAVLIGTLTSCTKQDLSEDDVLVNPEIEAKAGEEQFR
ncbi:hypothetical protein [uncultured Algibacter sp.]|nr:hypothetical protein [uncultured Algibacter sp.]